jgi:2-(1,2-epoxy-1,2-dihydrophenyl)acetyl-CoA isomerase
MELASTNRTLTAREAEAIGLVARVVPDDQLIAQAEALANELAHGPTRAYGGVKRLLYGTATNPLCEQMELENESIAEMARTADAQEGTRRCRSVNGGVRPKKPSGMLLRSSSSGVSGALPVFASIGN